MGLLGVYSIAFIVTIVAISIWNLWKFWKYIRKYLLLRSNLRLSINEYNLLIKYASKQKDDLFALDSICTSIKNLFILTSRQKQKCYPKITETPENIFAECSRAIFNLWWIDKSPAKISPETREIITHLTPSFTPSAEDLSKLYRYNPNASVKQANFLIANYYRDTDTECFYRRICLIADTEKRVIVSREILLQAYRFLVPHNRTYSLMCYLQYLNVKTYSNTFKHISIASKYNKLLFKNNAQKEYFDKICKQLLASKDIVQALESLEKISATRRKIELNFDAIKKADKEQSEVAQVLGQYLSEEDITTLLPAVSLEDNQHDIELTEFFVSSNFQLTKQDVSLFAQERNLFPEQLIQKINEIHYETLDDLLIEEKEESYTMSEEYYMLIQNLKSTHI